MSKGQRGANDPESVEQIPIAPLVDFTHKQSSGCHTKKSMFNDFIGLEIDKNYKITALLGTGAMGFVFQAYDRALERPVAVKIIKPEFASTLETTEAFIEEAHIVANLKHAHIVSVYDRGTQIVNGRNLAYLVMQYAVNGALADRLQAGPITLSKAEHILNQVCAALEYAHRQEVIHLDLKPHNILFDEQDKVLVADFGLARLLQATSHVKGRTGAGTPAYMSPEQFMGSDVGPFSDIYALAITLYEMLSGKPPRRDWSDRGLRVYLEHPLPSGVSAVIEKATRHEPQQRYRTASELAQDFTRALHASPVNVQPTLQPPAWSETDIVHPKDRRNYKKVLASWRWLLPLLVIGLALLLALNGFRMGTAKPPEATFTATLTPTATAAPTDTVVPTYTAPPTATAVPTTPTATAKPSPSPTPSVTSTTVRPTATASPTPYARIIVDQLAVLTGPGMRYEALGEVQRGYQLSLRGRSADGTWWQVDHLGWTGWIPAQAGEPSIQSDALPVVPTPPLPRFTFTPTPSPTSVPISTAMPTKKVTPGLQNPGFEGIRNNQIPGWRWRAFDNFSLEQEYNPDTSFDTPLFKEADDSTRFINGPTLQIDATAHVKFKVYIFQTVSASPDTVLRFQVLAQVYADWGKTWVAAGIDPNSALGCDSAQWNEAMMINQENGIVQLVAPEVIVGSVGQVTVCLYAEPLYPTVSSAVFFDDAQLIVMSQ